MKLVVICGMNDEKVRASLFPLVELEAVKSILLIRRTPFTMDKVKTCSSPSFLKWSLLLSEIYRIITLFFVCIRRKPDYIYGIYFVPHGIYAALAGSLFKIPVIQDLIGTDRPKVTKSKIFRDLLEKSEQIGVRGSTSLTQLSSLGVPKEKIFISKAVNVLDFDHFKPDQSAKRFDFIYVGRMDANKQLNIIVDAAAKLRQQVPDFTVGFVGDGPERENLQDQVARLKLNNHIHFTGSQDYQHIPAFLNQSKIFVMASAFEGLPVAMIEALSCGLPVIVPNVGDISDIAIHGYNAWLIDSNQPEDYSEAFASLLQDDRLYATLVHGALETRKKLIAEFSLQNVKNSWMRILNLANPSN